VGNQGTGKPRDGRDVTQIVAVVANGAFSGSGGACYREATYPAATLCRGLPCGPTRCRAAIL
jgi:hypothetical protein